MGLNNESLQVGNERINITVYYTAKKNKHGVVIVKIIDEKDYIKKTEEEKLKIKKLETAWRIINFKVAQDIYRDSLFFNQQTGQNETDFYKLRELTIKSALVEWTMVDEKGMGIPLNSKTIDETHPDIIFSLYNQYQTVTSDDSEEQKKT